MCLSPIAVISVSLTKPNTKFRRRCVPLDGVIFDGQLSALLLAVNQRTITEESGRRNN
jgi:hypothetical protein